MAEGTGRTMRAVHIKEFVKSLDQVTISSIPIPPRPRVAKQHHYLIRITHVSPTHVDTLYARGLHQNNNPKRGHVHPPFTLGMEFSGVVVEVYSPTIYSYSSADYKKGDKVWGTWQGAFAEYAVVPESAVRLVPSGLGLREVAAIGASSAPVSYGALVRVAKLRKGETCLVHAAAGGLGIVAVQIALALGANVIGTVGSDAKVKVVEELLQRASSSGNEVPKGSGVVRYDQPDWEKSVMELTGGRSVDVVFDTVGLVEKSIRCCAFGARVIILGFVGRGGEMEKVAMNRVLLKQINLLGYRFGETGRRMPEETVETWKGLDVILDSGQIKPVVHKDYIGLESVPEALKLMTTREVAGKIVVTVKEENENEVDEQRQDPNDRNKSRL